MICQAESISKSSIRNHERTASMRLLRGHKQFTLLSQKLESEQDVTDWVGHLRSWTDRTDSTWTKVDINTTWHNADSYMILNITKPTHSRMTKSMYHGEHDISFLVFCHESASQLWWDEHVQSTRIQKSDKKLIQYGFMIITNEMDAKTGLNKSFYWITVTLLATFPYDWLFLMDLISKPRWKCLLTIPSVKFASV